MKFLPTQFGVYELNLGIKHDFEDLAAEPLRSEYLVLVQLINIENGAIGYSKAINLLKDKKYSSIWAFWFVRNMLIDSISFYKKTLEESGLKNLQPLYKEISELAYTTLSSNWFKTELKVHNLSVDQEISKAINDTYQSNIHQASRL